ncbi:MAG TPA: bifunctional isocitrate dehydrogenase kinase/phosphatase [Thermoanaerobaculia bacterium]|nr:bifunctional isocitrate dehydrogenase kinase/phosphatase [Thermoanaerobaculia bacterium]
MSPDDAGRAGAGRLLAAWDAYSREFAAITRRAPVRFSARDWRGVRADALERLELYRKMLDPAVEDLGRILGPGVGNPAAWSGMKERFAALVAGRKDVELVETFFNSASRRIFHTVGVDDRAEFVHREPTPLPVEAAGRFLASFDGRPGREAAVRGALSVSPFAAGWEDLTRDAALATRALDRVLGAAWGSPAFDALDVLRPVFFRGKGAYLVGRVRREGRARPVVFALLNRTGRVEVDAVLCDEDEASIVFSFTRSYFHVDAEQPAALVGFLKTLMPKKPVGELYNALGFNKHGKTELYRDLLRHLAASDDRFVEAPGARGMVMLVFTLPSYDVVFKVIRDSFAPPKTASRKDVLDKYRLVFRHTRAGRLADVQEFEHLSFPVARFDAPLLETLLAGAAETVEVRGDEVVLRHLFTERRLTPLDIALKEASPAQARAAILDFGEAIRDLAKANVFPGDLLPKNFGLTRHGRVVFYDYDEIDFLTDVNFRELPAGADEEAGGDDASFFVGEHDVFPEEFLMFMGLRGPAREAFLERHADLLGVRFWLEAQRRERAGEIVDVYPYPLEARLRID